MIEIHQLRFSYPHGDFKLEVDRLSINRGSCTALIGPSGSGKTTLLRLLAGIYTPHSGAISIDGRQIETMGDAARRAYRISAIGLVFQDFELLDYLSVLDNILLPARINGALRLDRELRDRACLLAGRMGLSDKLRRRIDQLSQGEQQRVAICRAMIARPGLLLADEPTGSLDPKNKTSIKDLLFEQVREHKATLIMVTHDHSLLDGFDEQIEFPLGRQPGNG